MLLCSFACAGVLNLGHVIEWEFDTVFGTYRVNPLAEDTYVGRVRVSENPLYVAYRLAGVLPIVNFGVVGVAVVLLSKKVADPPGQYQNRDQHGAKQHKQEPKERFKALPASLQSARKCI